MKSHATGTGWSETILAAVMCCSGFGLLYLLHQEWLSLFHLQHEHSEEEFALGRILLATLPAALLPLLWKIIRRAGPRR